MTLTAAGLTVFDTMMALAFVVVWLLDRDSALAVIQALAGVAILLGLGAIVTGALVMNHNSRSSVPMPGSNWAKFSMGAGLLLLAATVMLPLISALLVLVGTDG